MNISSVKPNNFVCFFKKHQKHLFFQTFCLFFSYHNWIVFYPSCKQSNKCFMLPRYRTFVTVRKLKGMCFFCLHSVYTAFDSFDSFMRFSMLSLPAAKTSSERKRSESKLRKCINNWFYSMEHFVFEQNVYSHHFIQVSSSSATQ